MKETQTILFDTLLDAFLKDKKARIRSTTYIGYESVSRNHILPFFSGKRIDEIKPLLIREWQNRLLLSGLRPMYIRRLNTCLVSIFNWGCRFMELPGNPASLAGSIGVSSSERMDFWTLNEFNKFIAGVDTPLTKLAFELLYWTGMRVGELLALTPADFNFKSGEISVTKTYRRYHGRDIISPPKTKKSIRAISVNRSLMAQVKTFIKEDAKIKRNARIFPFTSNLLHYRMGVTCKATGVKRIRIHDLRHSHASLLIEMNVTPLLICERLGHEKVETTLNIYSHLYPNKQHQLSGRLETLFSGSGSTKKKR